MNKKLSRNTISSLLLQIITVISGFVLPRLIMHNYGSQVNGLVNSIAQFLSIITFLEFGVGAVIQSALYAPIVNNNNYEISCIISSADKFFHRIGKFLLFYVCVLILAFPSISNEKFDWQYTTILIIAMSINSCSQYFLGTVDKLLLTASQLGYIQNTAQFVAVIINTIACIILINFGCNIQTVKLTTSIIYLLRSLSIRSYIKKYYSINRKLDYQKEPIAQKWNGIAQHISYIILESTDIIILTIFSTLSNVSIYSAYYLVITSLKQFFVALYQGFQALLGQLWAKNDVKELTKVFDLMEWLGHTSTVIVFGCTVWLIVPFIQVYTLGLYDANYFQPLFSLIIVVAYALYCLSLPYWIMVLATGHYKETQIYFVFSAIINIIVSIIFVRFYGLVGVAIGTLAAMIFQIWWMIQYNQNHFIHRKFLKLLKQFTIDILTIIISSIFSRQISIDNKSYISWTIMAVTIVAIWGTSAIALNYIFYHKYFEIMIKKIRSFGHKNITI